MSSMNKRAAIYTRASKPISGNLSIQLDECRKFCEERDYEVVESLVIAEGASPNLQACKGLRRILEAAQRDEFDVLVYCHHIDLRMTNRHDFEEIYGVLRECGIEMISVGDQKRPVRSEEFELIGMLKKYVEDEIERRLATGELGERLEAEINRRVEQRVKEELARIQNTGKS